MVEYVGYARVSTLKQGRSGLGLDAQEDAIRRYLKSEDRLLAPLYVEVESGKRSDRPELGKALNHAKLTGATLLVAKLDRLSRNTRFLLTLIESGVDVAFCDLPHVSGAMGRFILTQMAAVAELEAGLISERTKAALAAAKDRGVVLGGFRGYKVDPARGLQARRVEATAFREAIAPVIDGIRREGFASASAIARVLNDRGIKTRRGASWTATQVQRVMV
jgi:DNA invertase Pin-like site-specific DNA recombinase